MWLCCLLLNQAVLEVSNYYICKKFLHLDILQFPLMFLMQGMDVIAFKSRLSTVKKEIFEMHSFYARKVKYKGPFSC